MAEAEVKECLKLVLSSVQEACKRRAPELQDIQPTLVAVSKTKPSNHILAAYEEGQRHFGENYVQELEDKSNNTEILEKCKEIRWHFIGHLQSNKVNKVLSTPNLYLVETVDSQKLAANLNKSWPKFGTPESKLKIMIQVNTSGEGEKNGIAPSEVCDVAKYVLEQCPNLHLEGLMTIGKFGRDPNEGPNPDFLSLRQCREDLCKKLGLDWKTVGLSMGMSDDFEHAIELGSTNIRVGSKIFGSRVYKNVAASPDTKN
nr:unnamed protein product [Callosobruchus chinensis]